MECLSFCLTGGAGAKIGELGLVESVKRDVEVVVLEAEMEEGERWGPSTDGGREKWTMLRLEEDPWACVCVRTGRRRR